MPSFWISFCDPGKPEGQQFLGACLVEAEDMGSALLVAHGFGANPGGEALGVVADPETVRLIKDHWKNRLLSREECAAMDDDVLAIQEANGVPIPHQPEEYLICKDHNKPH